MTRIKGCSSFKKAEALLRLYNKRQDASLEDYSSYFVYLVEGSEQVAELGYSPLREARLRFAQWLEAVADFNKYELRNQRGFIVSTGVAKIGTTLFNKKEETQ